MLLTLTLYLLFIGCSTPFSKVSLNHEKEIELSPLTFDAIKHWDKLAFKKALESFQHGCKRVKAQSIFYQTCQKESSSLDPKSFFQTYFRAYKWEDSLTDKEGLMTGYYEPLLQGTLSKDVNHTIPLLAPPHDLVKVYLSSVIPELKGKVVRGRLVNGKVLPYFSRKEITQNPMPENVICWVKDKVDLFFLQIQGSGRIALDNNQTIYVGYGDKNGHPYRSIGNYMIKNRIMSYGEMSLQGIKAWAKRHPDKIDAILNQNPSYLFFSLNKTPAKGAMGVVLTPKHSLAVDTRYIPLGTPVLVHTSHPLNGKPFSALAVAQDKGAAIKGGRRLDFFWGFGEEAAQLAGHTKSRAEMIVLLPKTFNLH